MGICNDSVWTYGRTNEVLVRRPSVINRSCHLECLTELVEVLEMAENNWKISVTLSVTRDCNPLSGAALLFFNEPSKTRCLSLPQGTALRSHVIPSGTGRGIQCLSQSPVILSEAKNLKCQSLGQPKEPPSLYYWS
jgi:hypothetical protein